MLATWQSPGARYAIRVHGGVTVTTRQALGALCALTAVTVLAEAGLLVFALIRRYGVRPDGGMLPDLFGHHVLGVFSNYLVVISLPVLSVAGVLALLGWWLWDPQAPSRPGYVRMEHAVAGVVTLTLLPLWLLSALDAV
jgi:hypothetical protein